jgi:hypothetical protein
MTDLVARLKITATAEVRDKDGTLVSATPVELEQDLTQEQLDALTEGAPE